MKYAAFVAFIATVPAANWMIGNIGTVCVPDGPCLVPVAPGLMAPSGVVLVGLALVLRDAVHEQLGARWAAGAIFVGALLSGFVAPPSLVVASAAAFLLSEAADMAVYSPLRKRHLIAAVVASGAVGASIDSAVFLYLAFGSLDFLAGQIVGKIWMTALAAAWLATRR
tara:strand:+ start:287 stop:790 length:504 start_codon:yes stop_codon:yes gene_type:complete